jgi:F-type H+-transporting ATPase subunit delta
LKGVAHRYANALADVALEKGNADKMKSDLTTFADVVDSSTDLRNFLANPGVTWQQKQAVVEKLVSRLGANRTLRNFLFVLVENRRAGLLRQICAAFEAELNVRMGVATAEVISARELSAEDRSNLMRALEQLAGQRVEATYSLNPELIAGALVRIGSTVYDGSVREQLNRIRARLAAE